MDKWQGQRLIAATRLARYERAIEAACRRALARRKAAVIANALTAAAGPDPFGTDAWDADVADEVEPVLADILNEITGTTIRRFPLTGDQEPRVFGRIDVASQVERFVRLVKGIGPDTARRINDQLSTGVGLGESIPQLTDRVESVFAMAEHAAERIARTETASAANRGANSAATAVNQEMPLTKQWISAQDDRTRESHAVLDGVEVGFDEQFDVGGWPADYPCDPQLPADEIVNCRCTISFSADTPEAEAAAEEAEAGAE